jgi:hypothetical protein
MTVTRRIELQFERRLLQHPAAYHLRRMRLALWLYLLLLTRLPKGQDMLHIEPMQVALDMGLPEGTVRSWLGHLKRLKYLGMERLNGTLRLRITRLGLPEPPPAPRPRFFTLRKIERALGESGNEQQLEEAFKYPDEVIRRALAGALAVPEAEIRKSRTALFIYLLKKYANPQESNPSA